METQLVSLRASMSGTIKVHRAIPPYTRHLCGGRRKETSLEQGVLGNTSQPELSEKKGSWVKRLVLVKVG